MRGATREIGKAPGLTVDNRTRYVTADLVRFLSRGLKAMGVRSHRLVVVVPSPIRSRGCAEIGFREHLGRREGRTIVIAIASPSRFDLRRLARLFEHEVAHTLGQDHEDMAHDTLWSLGRVPAWAQGARLRYRKEHR